MAGQPPDLRQPILGLAAWAGGLSGLLLPPAWSLAVGSLGVLAVCLGWVRGARDASRTIAAILVVYAAVAGAALLRLERVHATPVAALAHRHAAVQVRLVVAGDPFVTTGRFADYVTLRARVVRVTAAGREQSVDAPVLVLADASWRRVRWGETVRAAGRLSPADDPSRAAVFRARGSASPETEPAWWWRAAAGVREALRSSVAGRPPHQRALVPALVIGDDSQVGASLADDFRTTGLTHLMAVSGTNLTLLVGFLLITGRWLGVRGRWHYLIGGVGIVGFVMLARPEPSVLRAAVMGAVGLIALGPGGRHGGGRALGVAVTLLLLSDPWLATSPGFSLSVLATGGIVYLAPGWRDALRGWLPRWLAEAIAVPAAAQIACTPVVAAISGRVSLVAIGANLVAAPAVGPATVLGLIGGLVGLVAPAIATWCGVGAGWCVAWIAAVAERGAALPTPDLGWSTGPLALATLTACCLGLTWALPRLLRRPALSSLATLILVLATMVRLPTPGWPPGGWVIAVCDVGQGDAIALWAGPRSAVVVDTGPEPRLVDRCLSRLGVHRVPLVVLTHFHADHVGGLSGVIRGRAVGQALVTTLYDPPEGVTAVAAVLARARVPVRPVRYAETVSVGPVRLEVVWPRETRPRAGPGDGSTANNASVVLVVRVRDVTMLLTGDVEPAGQAALAGAFPGLRVDVLKVPHHGSRYQDLDFLTGLGARVAVASVGADNDYGHPAPETLLALARSGARVLRTDREGDVVVAEQDGRLVTFTRP